MVYSQIPLLNDLEISQTILGINSFFAHRSSPKTFLLLGKHSRIVLTSGSLLSMLCLSFPIITFLQFAFLLCLCSNTTLSERLFQTILIKLPTAHLHLLRPRLSHLHCHTLLSPQHLSVPNTLYCIRVYFIYF